MNVIARLEYELAYYDSAVHRFNHYTTRTPAKAFGYGIHDLYSVEWADGLEKDILYFIDDMLYFIDDNGLVEVPVV